LPKTLVGKIDFKRLEEEELSRLGHSSPKVRM
jgi:hypothetical protein